MSASPQRIGRYEIRRALGQGAMGVVYEALDPLIERVVAIKTINLNLSLDERQAFQARFFREAKSAGRLNHPGIVTVYDVGEDDNLAYIAMEFLNGQTLREWLDTGVVVPMSAARDIAVTLANALEYAHENGVVHRDVKPANIMVAPDRSVKLMDFGIAQLPTGSQTIHGTVLGSPKYMAPEQVAGRTVDGRSDVFALGVVLYELLTGRVPFDADSMSAIMYKIVHEDALPPSQLNARVPAAFDAIVARAMAKDPQSRFERARDFAAALAAIELGDATAGIAAQRVADRAYEATEATVILPPLDGHADAPGHAPVATALAQTVGANEVQPPKRDRSRFFFWSLQAGFLLAVIAVFLWASSGDRKPDAVDAAAGNGTTLAPNATAPVAASSDASKSPAADTTASDAPVSVSLAIYPWGEVWVNGKSVGVSPPLNEIKLPPGRHAIEIRNDSLPPHRETLVVVSGDNTKKIRHKFQ